MSGTGGMAGGGQWAKLWHGSAHELQGDTLKPGMRMGASAGSDYHKGRGQSIKDVVSASSDESKAWEMGHKSGGGRVRVHEVEPHPETRMGVEHIDHPQFEERSKRFNGVIDNKEFVAPSFRVKETHYMRPGHQGALIGVDWNDYRNPKHRVRVDENQRQPADMDHIHRTALVEHHDRRGGDPNVPEARAARLASRPEPHVLNPNQMGLF